MTYAVISETDYYGPSQTVEVVSEHDTAGEAREAADTYRPDWDERVQAHRLSHNQASATRGVAVEYIKTVAYEGEHEDDGLLSGYSADYVIPDSYGVADLYRRI